MATPAQHMANTLRIVAAAIEEGENYLARETLFAFNDLRTQHPELMTDNELSHAVDYIDNQVPIFSLPCGTQDHLIEMRDSYVLELRRRQSVLN